MAINKGILMRLIDTHVHLNFPDFKEERVEIMERAQEAGIAYFVNVGTDVETSKQSQELANKYENIFATAGVHPHDAKDVNEAVLNEIKEILKDPKVVAIGEVGLDFFRNMSPQEVQEKVLEQFLELYSEIDKPLIFHCRDAFDRLLEIVTHYGKAPYSGIFHCFSGDKDILKRCLDLGFHISFAGPLTYKKNDELREACQYCPLDRLLIETDAPYLPPQTKRGKRNETLYMMETFETMKQIHGMGGEALSDQILSNAKSVLRLPL